MLQSLKKIFRAFVVAVVVVVAVHLLEEHVPVCKCVAEAVRDTEVYARLQHALAHPEEILTPERKARLEEAVREGAAKAREVSSDVTQRLREADERLSGEAPDRSTRRDG